MPTEAATRTLSNEPWIVQDGNVQMVDQYGDPLSMGEVGQVLWGERWVDRDELPALIEIEEGYIKARGEEIGVLILSGTEMVNQHTELLGKRNAAEARWIEHQRELNDAARSDLETIRAPKELPMTTALLPDRFLLTQEHLAAALSLAGVKPGPRSSFRHLPSVDKPAAVLKNTKLLGEDRKLTAEADAALRVAANPTHVLAVTSYYAGDDNLRSIAFLQGSDGEHFVLQDQVVKGWDLVLLPTVAQVLALVDELLTLSHFPGQASATSVALDLPAYAALLAAADLRQEERLNARRARSQQRALVLTADSLEEALRKGLTATDTRWAVTAARLVSPVGLGAASGQLASGLERLRAAGLVERARGGFAPTDAGLGFMGSLGYLLNASAFTLGVADGEGQTTVETLSLFRTMASIWLVMWTSDAENEAAVHLLEVSSAGALRAGRDLLVASPAA